MSDELYFFSFVAAVAAGSFLGGAIAGSIGTYAYLAKHLS